jgi:hypothetical protein
MQTFGPTGAVDCYDLPCDLAYIDIPTDLEVLQFLTWLGAICSVGVTTLSLGCGGSHRVARFTVAATLVLGLGFWIDGTVGHGLARSVHDSEAGTRTAPGFSLFVASAGVMLWALFVLRAPRAPSCHVVLKRRP